MKVVKGAAKDFVIDIGFLIESQADDELPEMLLGTVRLLRYIFATLRSSTLVCRGDDDCVCAKLIRPDVKKFSTLPYAPINDSHWKQQQKKANISL